ncbi:hypothetical protein Bca4012_010413 [Brassica carinata]|uniref:Uncharacterized protein n=1 Tax=Brassica carinata TaxID=52824 RepID=A0A8X7V2M5_BRACI|nr:hypothetical protein Bca52824_035348 [Brassica carinata]
MHTMKETRLDAFREELDVQSSESRHEPRQNRRDQTRPQILGTAAEAIVDTDVIIVNRKLAVVGISRVNEGGWDGVGLAKELFFTFMVLNKANNLLN